MADELLDVCDENDNIIGQAMKSEILKKGLWHRAARVLIYNQIGEIFLQLRSENKELHPGCWDVGVAGHVGAGEHYIDAALREMAEEAGLSVPKENLEFMLEEKEECVFGKFNEKIFAYTYLTRFTGNAGEIRIQEEELQAFRFVGALELDAERKMFPEKFTPHSERYWAKLVGGVRERLKIGP